MPKVWFNINDTHLIYINLVFNKIDFWFGGENGIRTHERIAPLHTFQACAFNHSAISPKF